MAQEILHLRPEQASSMRKAVDQLIGRYPNIDDQVKVEVYTNYTTVRFHNRLKIEVYFELFTTFKAFDDRRKHKEDWKGGLEINENQ